MVHTHGPYTCIGNSPPLSSSGFMTPEERKLFENINSPHLKYWVPVVWFTNLAAKARKEGRIQDSVDLQAILKVLLTTWSSLQGPHETLLLMETLVLM